MCLSTSLSYLLFPVLPENQFPDSLRVPRVPGTESARWDEDCYARDVQRAHVNAFAWENGERSL